LLALLYTVTALGFALNLHYCGRLLTSVTLNSSAKSCGMFAVGKMKCCKDKKFEVKVKDVHQGQPTSALAKKFAAEIPQLPYGAYHCVLPQVLLAGKFLNKAPPDHRTDKLPVFLKNCTFRI